MREWRGEAGPEANKAGGEEAEALDGRGGHGERTGGASSGGTDEDDEDEDDTSEKQEGTATGSQ